MMLVRGPRRGACCREGDSCIAAYPWVLYRGTQQIRAAQASYHPPILWRLGKLGHETFHERPSFQVHSDFPEPSLCVPVTVEQAGLQSVEVVDWILDEVIAARTPRHSESFGLCLVEG